MRSITPLLAIVVVVAFITVVSQTPVDPWRDEAMLIANLRLADLNVAAPLPHYEQAAPIGYLMVAQWMLNVTGSTPPYEQLRLLSAVFMAAGMVICLMSRPFRRDGVAAMVFVALLIVSPLIWTYAAEIRHYSAEFFATAFGWPLATEGRTGRYVKFIIAVAIASLFSFTLPIIVIGILGGAGWMRLRSQRRRRTGEVLVPVGFLVTAGIVALGLTAFYLLVNRELLVYQISAYDYGETAKPDLVRLIVHRVIKLFDLVINIYGPIWLPTLYSHALQWGLPPGICYQAVRLLAAALLSAALWFGWKRSPLVAASFAIAFLTLAVLTLVGAVHLPYSRQVIFLLPLSAILNAMAISHGLERLLAQHRAVQAAIVLMLIGITAGIVDGLRRNTQDVTPLLQRIAEQGPNLPVWIHGDAQPAVDVLEPRPARIIGSFDKQSGPTAWQVRGGQISTHSTMTACGQPTQTMLRQSPLRRRASAQSGSCLAMRLLTQTGRRSLRPRNVQWGPARPN